MKIRGKKVAIIYLEDWQQRMVKDFLHVDCHTWQVPIDNGSQAKYGVGPPDDPTKKKMYLTDWQIRELKDEAGEYCEFVELTDGTITDYGVDTDVLRKK